MKDLEYLGSVCTAVEVICLGGEWDWEITFVYKGETHTVGGWGCRLKNAAAEARSIIKAIKAGVEVKHANI